MGHEALAAREPEDREGLPGASARARSLCRANVRHRRTTLPFSFLPFLSSRTALPEGEAGRGAALEGRAEERVPELLPEPVLALRDRGVRGLATQPRCFPPRVRRLQTTGVSNPESAAVCHSSFWLLAGAGLPGGPGPPPRRASRPGTGGRGGTGSAGPAPSARSPPPPRRPGGTPRSTASLLPPPLAPSHFVARTTGCRAGPRCRWSSPPRGCACRPHAAGARAAPRPASREGRADPKQWDPGHDQRAVRDLELRRRRGRERGFSPRLRPGAAARVRHRPLEPYRAPSVRATRAHTSALRAACHACIACYGVFPRVSRPVSCGALVRMPRTECSAAQRAQVLRSDFAFFRSLHVMLDALHCAQAR